MQSDATATNQTVSQERVYQRDLVLFRVLYSITFQHWRPELFCPKKVKLISIHNCTTCFECWTLQNQNYNFFLIWDKDSELSEEKKQDFAEGAQYPLKSSWRAFDNLLFSNHLSKFLLQFTSYTKWAIPLISSEVCCKDCSIRLQTFKHL